MELTPRQESVYKVILAYYRQHRFSPTVREIGEQLGLAGPAGIHRILKVLEARGYLSSTPGKNRSWRPVARELTPPLLFEGADREKIRIMGRYVGLIRQNRWGKQSGSLKKSGMRV